MDGRKFYREIEEEKNIDAGLGALILDFFVMLILSYFYLSWIGVILTISIAWFSYKYPKILLIMMAIASVIWGLVLWKLSLKIGLFFFEQAVASTLGIIVGVIGGLGILSWHLSAYDRIQEWIQEKARRGGKVANGHLPNSSQPEPDNPTPDGSRKDYSEHRSKGFVVRDYRAGRDRDTKGE